MKAILGSVHYDIVRVYDHCFMLIALIRSRGMKKTRDAAQQFTLVARGLEGTSFGYTSVSM